MNLRLSTKITISFALMLMIFLIAVTVFLFSSSRVVKNFVWVVKHDSLALTKAYLVQKLIVDMETGQRGFLITGRDEFLEPYHFALDRIDSQLEQLKELLQHDSKSLVLLRQIERGVEEWQNKAGRPEIEVRRRIISAEYSHLKLRETIETENGKKIIDEVRQIARRLEEAFKRRKMNGPLRTLYKIERDLYSAESGQRGFLITGKDRFLKPYNEGLISIGKNIHELKRSLRKRSRLRKQVERIEASVKKWEVVAAEPEIEARAAIERNPAELSVIVDSIASGAGKDILNELRSLLDSLANRLENMRVIDLAKSQDTANYTQWGVVILLILAVIASFLWARYIVKTIMEPINQLTLGARRVAHGDLDSQVNVLSSDELGQLSHSFNYMVAKLKSSLMEKNQAEKQANQAAKLASIGELAAGVGHEINNPLAIAIGNIERIKKYLGEKGGLDPEIERMMDKHHVASQRIKGIVDGLRTYARINLDEEKSVSIQSAVEQTLGLMTEILEKEGVTLRKRLEPGHIYIKGSVGKLQQILMNLISNARDATQGRELRYIEVSLTLQGKKARLEVSDNGMGMDEKTKNKIFDPFFTTKEIGKGTGMGMGIVRKFVDEFGGNIFVESVPGEGTRFIVEVPTIERHWEVEPLGKQEIEVNSIHFNGEKVLIVDDEEDIREILRDLLEDFNLTVEEASHGKEGLEKVSKTHYKFIFTDMKMPIMDGPTFIKEIQKLELKEPPIIFAVTGGINVDLSKENSEIGALIDGCLLKPFDEDQVQELFQDAFPLKKVA